MVDRIESRKGRLTVIRRAIFTIRLETPQERADAESSLHERLMKEPVGSQRYDLLSGAYWGLKRQPERIRAIVFSKEIPIWF